MVAPELTGQAESGTARGEFGSQKFKFPNLRFFVNRRGVKKRSEDTRPEVTEAGHAEGDALERLGGVVHAHSEAVGKRAVEGVQDAGLPVSQHALAVPELRKAEAARSNGTSPAAPSLDASPLRLRIRRTFSYESIRQTMRRKLENMHNNTNTKRTTAKELDVPSGLYCDPPYIGRHGAITIAWMESWKLPCGIFFLKTRQSSIQTI